MSYADFQLDTSSFESTMRRLASISTRTDEEIITMNSGMILRSIAFNSPKRTGNMNKGWLPAWRALGLAGTPNTISKKKPPNYRRYIPEGRYVDNRHGSGVKFFEFVNTSHYLNKRGGKYRYPIAVATRTGFMRKAEREAAQKFDRLLQKNYTALMRGRL